MSVQIIPHLELPVEFTLFHCSWVPCSNRLVALGSKLDGRGHIAVYQMGSQKLQPLGEGTTNKALKCGTFDASAIQDRYLATGDFDGRLQLWDLEDLSRPLWSVGAHEDLINAIDGAGGLGAGGADAPELATASRDGSVKVWDPRSRDRPVACIKPECDRMRRDAWALALNQDRTLVSGYDNGDVKMFDLRTMSAVWESEVPKGVCSLQFDRKDASKKVLATCLEGRFHIWDMRPDQDEEKKLSRLDCYTEEKATVWSGSHLPQNRDVFMTAAGAGSSLALWRYSYADKESDASAEQVQDVELGEQPISSFAWSPDKMGLGVCVSFDQKIRTIIVTQLSTL